ncbi:MAG TPA: hypothetical protein VGM23_13200 [Armatimonadota bacterium]
MVDDFPLVPLAPLAELWGAKLTVGKDTVTFTLGKQTLTGRIGTTCVLRAGTPYVPLDNLAIVLGVTVTPKAEAFIVTPPNAKGALTLPKRLVKDTPLQHWDCALELYAVPLDGTGRRRLTYNAVFDLLPKFSPDGTRMLYLQNDPTAPQDRGVLSTRWVLRACADPIEHPFPAAALPGNGPVSYYLSWADFTPDGREVLFTANRSADPKEITAADICLADVTGRNLRILAQGGIPRCSPDGRRIVYSVDDFKNPPHIYLMNRDGTQQHEVCEGFYAEFAGDSSTLLVSYRAPNTKFYDKIYRYTLDAAGKVGNDTPLLADPTAHSECYSPDGKRIAFLRTGDKAGVYLADADGRNERRLDATASAIQLSFTPDGQRLVYVRLDERAIYAIRTAGGIPRKLATLNYLDPQRLHYYTITPDSTHLVFMDVPEVPPQGP